MIINWVKRFFYILLVLPFTFLAGELFTHILLPQKVDAVLNIMQSDPIVGYIYQPNANAFETGREYHMSYDINSLGLRDYEYDLNETGVFRVLLFGDSFSESHGVTLEESLSKQIEKNLQVEFNKKQLGLKVEVVNVSFGGYSPYHYWKSYERWKKIFNPQAVLIGFYMGNDFQCEDENIHYEIDKGEIVGFYYGDNNPRRNNNNPVTTFRKWLARKSQLYVLLRNYFYYNDVIGFFTNKAKAKESTKQLEPYQIHESEGFKVDREKCYTYLKRLKNEASSDGVQVGLIAIPNKFEIMNSYLENIINTQGINMNDIDLDKPYKDLELFCNTIGVYFYDPRTDMKKGIDTGNNYYFMYDGHWNNSGIETAAASVVRQWKLKKILPFDQNQF